MTERAESRTRAERRFGQAILLIAWGSGLVLPGSVYLAAVMALWDTGLESSWFFFFYFLSIVAGFGALVGTLSLCAGSVIVAGPLWWLGRANRVVGARVTALLSAAAGASPLAAIGVGAANVRGVQIGWAVPLLAGGAALGGAVVLSAYARKDETARVSRRVRAYCVAVGILLLANCAWLGAWWVNDAYFVPLPAWADGAKRIILVLSVAIPAMALRGAMLLRRERAALFVVSGVRCPKCGYALEGLREKGCPECGWGREGEGEGTEAQRHEGTEGRGDATERSGGRSDGATEGDV